MNKEGMDASRVLETQRRTSAAREELIELLGGDRPSLVLGLVLTIVGGELETNIRNWWHGRRAKRLVRAAVELDNALTDLTASERTYLTNAFNNVWRSRASSPSELCVLPPKDPKLWYRIPGVGDGIRNRLTVSASKSV